MRFEEAYWAWQQGRFSQEEAARLLGVCERTFRRYLERFEEEGPTGLMDKRIGQISHRRAPVDEALALVELYRREYPGWNVRHFHSWYRQDHGGTRSYTWAKLLLQAAGVVEKAPGRGKHRKRRERMALPGMLVHQDASRHQWIEGQYWNLVVTMDDATGEHTSTFFCQEEGTCSSLHGIGQTIGAKGLFCSLYTDRGSHYFHTPEAGAGVDRTHLTRVGRALQQLGIEHIAAYSHEARGRSERAFGTHQERVPKELAKAAITDMAGANAYLQQVYLRRHNADFTVAAKEAGSAFVPFLSGNLPDILCEQFERSVGNDNCVSFQGWKLQIPASDLRPNYVKTRVRVHRYVDATLAIFHGPRRLASYDDQGQPMNTKEQKAA